MWPVKDCPRNMPEWGLKKAGEPSKLQSGTAAPVRARSAKPPAGHTRDGPHDLEVVQ